MNEKHSQRSKHVTHQQADKTPLFSGLSEEQRQALEAIRRQKKHTRQEAYHDHELPGTTKSPRTPTFPSSLRISLKISLISAGMKRCACDLETKPTRKSSTWRKTATGWRLSFC